MKVALPYQKKSIENISFVNESYNKSCLESNLSILHETRNESGKTNISPVNSLTAKALSHSLRFNHSYQALEHNAKLINSTPGAKVHIPESVYRMKKMFPPLIHTEFYIHCKTCNEYSVTRAEQTECVSCSRMLKRAHSKYFVYLPLKSQLTKSINDHFDDILSYYENDKFCDNSDIIFDIQNSIQYKKAREKFPYAIILPLAINTDGARLFNSTNKSIWPIQIIQNFLPPKIRYTQQNIIVAAICEGKICSKNSYNLQSKHSFVIL